MCTVGFRRACHDEGGNVMEELYSNSLGEGLHTGVMLLYPETFGQMAHIKKHEFVETQ